jgi:hypothetical protein
MAITLKERAASAVPTPEANKATLFVDSADGMPKFKDDTGALVSLEGPEGPPGVAGDMTNPMTTLGDVIVGGASGAPARLAVGTNGHVLTVVTGEPAWAAPPSGGSAAGGAGAVQTSDGSGGFVDSGVDVLGTSPNSGLMIQLDSGSGSGQALVGSEEGFLHRETGGASATFGRAASGAAITTSGATGILLVDGQACFTPANDGSGSGLDADLLRGTTPSAAGLALLDDADAAAQRTTLGAEKAAALVTVTDATDDLEAAWASDYTRFTHSAGAKTLNVRTNATHAVPTMAKFPGRNAAANDLTIAPAGGVTINAPAGGTLVIPPQGTFTLVKVATDEWDLFGETEPA